MDPYEILGLRRGALVDEIKAAFREKSQKYHPDVGGDAWAFRRIEEAYQTLMSESLAGGDRDYATAGSGGDFSEGTTEAASFDQAAFEPWIGLACIALVAFTAGSYWWWGWLGLFTFVLWALISAASFGAVFFAWSAWSDEVDDGGRQRHVMIALSLALLAGLSFWGLRALAAGANESATDVVRQEPPTQVADGDDGRATWGYWQQLDQINEEVDRTAPVKKTESLPQLIASLQNSAKHCRQAVDHISALPLRDVDTEVVAFGAEQMQLLADAGQILARLAQLVDDKRELYEHAVSWEVLAESFVRGFLGDPMGKTREIRQSDQRLGEEFLLVQRRIEALQSRGHALRARGYQLRARLSNQYDREFPPID